MANANVQRLATTRKAATAFSVPPPPEIPDSLRTVSDIKIWWKEEFAGVWWQRFQSQLKAQLADLKSQT